MTGGQGSFFDQSQSRSDESRSEDAQMLVLNSHKINVISASDEELTEHEKYMNQLAAKGKCLWRAEEIN